MLSPAQRKALKARAHRLHPVVTIGEKGLTDAVLREIDLSLKSHELIKVRVSGDDRKQREAYLARICEALDAAPVQEIGKVLVIWRGRPASDTGPPPKPAR
jgi:putative YhbY family RNA-binding protein